MKKWLIPDIRREQWGAAIRIAMLGAIIAGTYGIIHDQISYTISPEYFTRMKFRQFHYADFGLSERVFVGEIGFLATWWVGLIAGWTLSRGGLLQIPIPLRKRYLIRSFAILLFATPFAGLIGALLGTYVASTSDLRDWDNYRVRLQIVEMKGFVIVAYLHAAGYLGALTGLVVAIWYVRKIRKSSETM